MSSSLRRGSIFANLTVHQRAAFSDIPALVPPSGVKPNFIDPNSNSKPFFVVTSTLLVIMTLFVANRFYTKTYIVRKYTWDDLVGLLATIFTVVSYAFCVWGTLRGNISVHEWNLSISQVAREDQVPVWFFAAFNAIALGTITVTFFIAYLNIFGPLRWLRLWAWTGSVFTAIYHIAIAIAFFVLTTPAHGHTWFSATTIESYQYLFKLLVPIHVVGLAIDSCIIVLPIIAVSQLQMPTRRKIGICFIFLTGLMALIASVLTVYYRYRLVKTPDVTRALMPVCIFTFTEMCLGIICLCIPAAARSWRHHSDSYQRLKSSLGSKILRRSHTHKDPTNNSSSRKQPVYSGGPYRDLETNKASAKSPFAHVKGPHTVVRSGNQHEVDEDGIHLTYEMTTTVQEKSKGNMNV